MNSRRTLHLGGSLALAALATVVAVACGSSSDGGTAPPATGGAGAGGSAGAAGKAGSGGKSGSSGSAGTGGAAGSSAGSAGTAGSDTGGNSGTSGTGGEGGEAGANDNFALKRAAYGAVPFPSENPDSDAKDTLGKILFWDEQVSSDKTVACGTCHRTGNGGGSDPRADVSRSPGADGILGTSPTDPNGTDDVHGSMGIKRCTEVVDADAGLGSTTVTRIDDPVFHFATQVTGRRAPTYLDAMFAPNIFWDGRATSAFTDPITNTVAIAQGGGLESQSVGPPLGPAEMACDSRTWDEVLNRLRNVSPLGIAKTVPPALKSAITSANGTYQQLFATAFGDATANDASISVRRFAFAIATHERHLTSNQTPWDKYNAYLRGDAGGDANALTAAQKHGLDLFLNKAACATCHVPPLFTDAQFHNLGFIALSGPKADLGRSALAGHASDPPGQVKTPSLRNVGLRAHEGLFHYGFGPGADLKTLVQTYNNPPAFQDPTLGDPTASVIEALNLTADEIDDLVDFLQNGLTDPRVESQAFPFDRPTLSTE